MSLQIKKIASLTGHNGSVYALAPGISEATFFSGSSDRFVALWNLEKLETEKFAAQFPAIVYALCHIPEKQLLLAGTSAGSIHVIDLKKKEEIRILQHHTGPVFDIKYNAKSNCIYSAGGDGNFAVCSAEDLSFRQSKKLCEEKVRSIDISTEKGEILVAAGDCRLYIFDLDTLQEKHSFIAHELSANIARYSPDGNTILSGGRDAHLKIWDAWSYALIKDIPAHNFAVYDIAFSPDATLFATASRDKTIKIWNTENFELQVRINKENHEGHVNSVNKLLWPDYKNRLLSCGDDRTVMVWEIG